MQDNLPAPGDLIWIRSRQWRVRSTRAGLGVTRVTVDAWPHPERRSFLLPCDRWAPDVPRRGRRASQRRALAWLAACASRIHRAEVPWSVVASRADVLPYQLEPALAMLAGRRRVLVADDVGLGKTIQAALIIAEILNRRAEARVLVVAPASLLLQWAVELQTRFSLAPQLADAGSFARLRADHAYLENPWQGPGLWLVSPDYLKQPHVMEGLPRAPFDLVVIDEAHAMAGDSQRHGAVDAIARAARRVVLLTATPHDGDDRRFQRLVGLGATGSRADMLTVFKRTREVRTRNVRRLSVGPGQPLSKVLSAIESFARAGKAVPGADSLQLLCAVFRKRALSSVAALRASLHRRLTIVDGGALRGEPAEPWVQPELAFGGGGSDSDEDDIVSSNERLVLGAPSGLTVERERAWLRRLLAAAETCGREPKVEKLAALLARADEPVVVFTEYRDSLLALAAALEPVRRVTVLHGGLAGIDQRHALSEFTSGRTSVLLATDVASQGLNLQHRARWVVHFDFPWSPMRLEQRNGRVDRIGQQRRVHVTAIGLRHPAEATLRQRLSEKQQRGDAAALAGCRRWRRPAEGIARLFTRQRALAARWLGPDPVAVLEANIRPATLRRLGVGPALEVRTLVEIPLVTQAGEIIERHIGWKAGEAADSLAALCRRARALTSRERRLLSRLQAAQATPGTRSLHQAGLFEGRGAPGQLITSAAPEPPAANVRVIVGAPRALLKLERR